MATKLQAALSIEPEDERVERSEKPAADTPSKLQAALNIEQSVDSKKILSPTKDLTGEFGRVGIDSSGRAQKRKKKKKKRDQNSSFRASQKTECR